MNEFNGKILSYSRTDSVDTKRKLIAALPKRTDFISKTSRVELYNDAMHGKQIQFLPNDLLEIQAKEDGKMTQKLVVFGILKNGSKACIVTGNLEMFFDIEIPEGIDSNRFANCMYAELNNSGCYPIKQKTQVVELYPFKFYHEQPKKYLRLSFNTLFQRKKGIQHIHNMEFEYASDTGEDIQKVYLQTASDDLSCFWRKYSRDSGVKLCDWITLSKYKLDKTEEYTKKASVEFTFIVDAADLRPATKEETKDKIFKLDKTTVLTWDLETFAAKSDGNAPYADKVFTDTIEMDSMTFHFYCSRDPLIKICLTTVPCPPMKDCLIILCGDQLDILHCKALVLENLAPDFVVGFNDGLYDWDFVIKRIQGYDKEFKLSTYNLFKKRASCLTATDERLKYNIKGVDNKPNIKIAADIAVDNVFFKVPGYINIDVRTVFRKLYPTAEKSSLAFFLEKNKLGGKEDMPYLRMFKIFKLMREFASEVGKDYKKIIARVDEIISQFGEDYKYFEDKLFRVPDDDLEKLTEPSSLEDFQGVQGVQSTYSIERLTIGEIRLLLKESKKVVHYCNVDAQRCQDLLKVRNVISDFREMANISYTSMTDAVDRAGGMKVRNLVMARGKHLAFSTITKNSVKDPRKYPGALVIPPVKNLSRDHVYVKRLRRKLRANKKPGDPYNIKYENVDPQSKEFMKELINEFIDELSPTDKKRDPIDENTESDRPNAGLDASSLYPSLVMVYNLSPEKAVVDKQKAEELMAKGMRLEFVSFLYGLPDEAPENKQTISGWFVQHIPHKDVKTGKYTYEGMGIYAILLKELFDSRSELKALMEIYAKPKEALDKIFEKKSILDEVAALPLAEQKEFLRSKLQDLIDLAKAELEKNGGKKYYKFKLHDAIETYDYFNKITDAEGTGWFCENSEVSGQNIVDIIAEIEFQFIYYNNKQLARKVFMNTFYGEAGNNISPFFMLEVAGGITYEGQSNLMRVKKFIEQRGYRVKYGDTDSLYTEPPQALFAEVDKLYEAGKITKLEYWTRMIELTMEDLDKLKGIVNTFLEEFNGTNLLKFAYEEVLFPYAFVGKKKYIGIPHVGIVKLAACMPNCPLEFIMKPGTLFIRGFEMKKRGGSEFMKLNCYEVWKDAFCIENTETLREIVERHLSEIAQKEWKDSMFIRSKRYKLPLPGKPGNVSVLKFIERMKYIETNYPDLGVRVPEVGERFDVIYAKKYPWMYGVTGTNKQNVSVGDQMEFYTSLSNDKYKEYLANRGMPLEINLDYYMEGEICGQFARFLMYHPDYDDLFEDWMYQDDDAYKENDKRAHGHVKKTLIAYYRQRFADVYPQADNIYKQFQEKIAPIMNNELMPETKLSKKIISQFMKTDNIIRDAEGNITLHTSKDIEGKISKKLIDDARKLGERNVADVIGVICRMGYKESVIQGEFVASKGYRNTSVFDDLERIYNELLVDDLQEMQYYVKRLGELSKDDLAEEGRIIDIIKESNNLDMLLSQPIKARSRDDLQELSKHMQDNIAIDFSCIENIKKEFNSKYEEKVFAVNYISQLYYDIAVKYKAIAEFNNAREYLKNKYAIRKTTVNKAADADDFADWLRKQH